MVLPALIVQGKRTLEVNVMLDPCSTGSYVSEDAAEELQLQGRTQDLTISGTGGAEVKTLSRRVELLVANTTRTFSAKLEANVLDNITGDTPAIPWSELKTKWSHLELIPFEKVAKRKQIDVLIGSDHPVFHRVIREVHGDENSDPIARQTPLGWVCFGPTLKNPLQCKSRAHTTWTYHSEKANNDETNELLRRFWELDSIGIKDENAQAMTPNELTAVKRAEETLAFKDGRYEIGIPWKEGEPKFENNYDMAYSRLKNLETSLSKKPEVASAYNKIIEDYLEKGYIKKVPLTEDEQWLLPHFPVIRNEKTTTKVRIVFDAAAKLNGKSLNDAVLSGPKLQRELVDVLIRFRRAPVAISADISQMFLQVGLLENDRPYHRFLWRELEQTKQPDVYEFLRLPFGNTASPFCAQHVLHYHAESQKDLSPEAAETVDNAMYVDDVLDSCETIPEAKALRRQASELLSGAGFDLKKWVSNEVAVIEDIPIEDRLPGLEIRDGNLPTLKTLGVLWEATNDTFTFQTQEPSSSEVPTKRSVLSAIAKLFDPLQLLSPFTMRARVLMQEIWAAGLEWDDVLPDDLRAKWNAWKSELKDLSAFSVPRCLRLSSPVESQLHTFSDASKDAYAAVAYLLCKYSNHPPTSCLIASKTRVSPVKSVTIPRLELMGAILASRLAKCIQEILPVQGTSYWTDSTNVLYWIRSQSRVFKPFVANRIGEIQRNSNPDQWRHVPGDLNPADLPTRGLPASKLAHNRVWMEGPAFLINDESTWPEKLPNDPTRSTDASGEEKKTQTHVTKEADAAEDRRLDPKRYSSLGRLIRVTAWTKRFIKNCKTSTLSREMSKTLQQDELTNAKTFWLRQAQAECFPDREKEKKLQRFSPQVDDDGLLRVNGRLHLAEELPFDTRHPVILPKDHPVTHLIITDAHQKLGHGSGTEHLLTELRSQFWILQGRRAVRTVVESCHGCRRRFSARPTGQMMAPLPTSRLALPLRAFERVGTDYGGPFITKQGRGKSRLKRYLCLFTCLATRAVHLEMAYSLDTESFINAFIRMTARRGTPTYILSDNGTNFVGAEKEICHLVQAFDQEKIINETTRHQPIEWKFNPPSAPHFGGVFESMIKSAKKAMRAIFGDAEITDEELHTAICSAEGLLNSRPITYVSSSHDDMVPLTPNHFLVGQLGGQFAPETLDNEEVFNPKQRWRRVQQLIGQFWKRWRKEFLPSLNVRGKWFQPKRELTEGDVVLLVEPNAKRGEWPLGRIVEVYRGADKLIRVVKVQVGKTTFIRPVHRLCPLEC